MSNANPRMSNANESHSNQNLAHQQNGKEQIDTGTASSDTFPGGFQAIATAYGDYAKKSFEDTKSFVEKLSGAKSFDKVIEIQTEFAKTAYETFVTEITEDYRIVRRCCQAILQAIRWFSCNDDPDQSISPTPRCQSKIFLRHRGGVFRSSLYLSKLCLLNHPSLSRAFHAKRRSTANYELLFFHYS